MKKLVLIRHGESQWNLENRFTGWVDVDLSDKGVREAREAGRLLKENNYQFEFAYTSVLKRAIRTLWICLEELDAMWLPARKDWRLNERHYGALQGLNKQQVAEQYGEAQVHRWRRSFLQQPPPLQNQETGLYYARAGINVPACESLRDTLLRCTACWSQHIYPRLCESRQVLIVAHGNTLRAFLKFFDRIDDEQITGVNIPTGKPLVYEFDDHMQVADRYYLSGREPVNVG